MLKTLKKWIIIIRWYLVEFNNWCDIFEIQCHVVIKMLICWTTMSTKIHICPHIFIIKKMKIINFLLRLTNEWFEWFDIWINIFIAALNFKYVISVVSNSMRFLHWINVILHRINVIHFFGITLLCDNRSLFTNVYSMTNFATYLWDDFFVINVLYIVLYGNLNL